MVQLLTDVVDMGIVVDTGSDFPNESDPNTVDLEPKT